MNITDKELLAEIDSLLKLKEFATEMKAYKSAQLYGARLSAVHAMRAALHLYRETQ